MVELIGGWEVCRKWYDDGGWRAIWLDVYDYGSDCGNIIAVTRRIALCSCLLSFDCHGKLLVARGTVAGARHIVAQYDRIGI
jgi:hypothetical protein